MQFLKENLLGNHYDWQTEVKHDKLTSDPDRRPFDPVNGNQLLYMINYFGIAIGKLSIADGLRIESLISVDRQPQLKSEIAVFNWLKKRYLYY